MPLLIPLVAGGLGFGGGFIVSNGINNLLKLGLLAGAGYLVYTQVSK